MKLLILELINIQNHRIQVMMVFVLEVEVAQDPSG